MVLSPIVLTLLSYWDEVLLLNDTCIFIFNTTLVAERNKDFNQQNCLQETNGKSIICHFNIIIKTFNKIMVLSTWS